MVIFFKLVVLLWDRPYHAAIDEIISNTDFSGPQKN